MLESNFSHSFIEGGDLGPPIGEGLGVAFYGEIPTSEFITGDALASEIGLTAGTSQFSNESWLHFTLDGVEGYLAKKPFRHSISWNHIDAVGAVFGTKTVNINGSEYKVRSLKGASADPFTGTSGYDIRDDDGSEWNRLMYPIHSGIHIDSSNPKVHTDPLSLPFGTLAQYSDRDLHVQSSAGNGSYSWCQETRASSSSSRLLRGYYGVSHRNWYSVSTVSSGRGWRPFLELIS